MKIFDMFTELFKNVNIDSIQETYPKINVYNKVIMQYIKETNTKYGFNLKFTKLEALEVGLWARTFQVAGNEQGPQLPDKQWSEPLKTQQPQHTSILINELPITEKWIEAGQKTSVAAQWSCSMVVVLLIIGDRNGTAQATSQARPTWHLAWKHSRPMSNTGKYQWEVLTTFPLLPSWH